ncbi:hypothetical protein PF008_g13195 [Phytophthora fragariae]|uniref:Secreted protein n=1 Tax=Phytophthora fragariae TaxID=53985 RepID=A0A6G0RKS2_9STRA|nr:hypothetical protein PF008_g13195 [Phytophthora fragariae]
MSGFLVILSLASIVFLGWTQHQNRFSTERACSHAVRVCITAYTSTSHMQKCPTLVRRRASASCRLTAVCVISGSSPSIRLATGIYINTGSSLFFATLYFDDATTTATASLFITLRTASRGSS